MDNVPTDKQKERLPKWAQEYMLHLERENERRVKLINKLDAGQMDLRPDGHDWEFREAVMDKEVRERYINASGIELEAYGIIVHLSPNSTHKEIRVSWDTGKGYDWSHDVALLPSAANSLRLKLMKMVEV
jgi:hypothetical protein